VTVFGWTPPGKALSYVNKNKKEEEQKKTNPTKKKPPPIRG